jgi:hypothetical protein
VWDLKARLCVRLSDILKLCSLFSILFAPAQLLTGWVVSLSVATWCLPLVRQACAHIT